MAPLPRYSNPLPRIITYFQTHHDRSGKAISVLPILQQPGINLTHIIVAAIHINHNPNNLTLNDHSPSDDRFAQLWAEMRILQAAGIKVMGMLGGAAKGTYQRLDASQEQFEMYYEPLQALIWERNLNGLDLDVEEEMSLRGIVRLIDRLRSDFGPDFIITLAPVAAALLGLGNLSGFDYEALEVMRGREIAWYNTQFYCGWGDASNLGMYSAIVFKGYAPNRVVLGVVTSPDNGSGFVPWEILSLVVKALKAQYPNFGGVMGWEYFNSRPGGTEAPWEWARNMTKELRPPPPRTFSAAEVLAALNEKIEENNEADYEANARGETDASVPKPFEYFTDEDEDEEVEVES